MKVIFAASEIFPYVKTGGLGDVAGALPQALAAAGVDIRLMLPGFPAILEKLTKTKVLHKWQEFYGATDASLLRGELDNGLIAYVLDAPRFFHRTTPYTDENGLDWPDNYLRFAAFCQAAVQIADIDKEWKPDVIHGHDWQAGLIPAYLHYSHSPVASVFTIHNIAYQGLFPASTLPQLKLPAESFVVEGLEYYLKVGFLKAGLYYSDKISTVSPTYAREIQASPEGCGLEGLLATRSSDLMGILNGIDNEIWNPETDPVLHQSYSVSSIAKRDKNKRALLQEFGFSNTEDKILFAVVSRMTPQKGLDLLVGAIPTLLGQNAQFLILGSGDNELEAEYRNLAAIYPDHVKVRIGYDESLAHRIFSGADAIIAPSRFEPCGLVQLYALRYGALPIVRNTGGLADTVTDLTDNKDGTGFVFQETSTQDLEGALLKAAEMYFNAPETWKAAQARAMAQDFGWENAAHRYLKLYDAACGKV